MKYIMIEIDCPECGGEGYTENMTWLTYDGAQTWQRDECSECSGDKFVEAPARCTECGEEIPVDEMATNGSWFAHASCIIVDPTDTISPDDNKCPKCAYSNMYGAPECEKCETPLDNGGRIE